MYRLQSRKKWLRVFCKKYRRNLWTYFSLDLISIFCGILFVLLTKEVLDLALITDFQDLWPVISVMIATLLLGFSSNLYAGKLNERTRAKMLIDLQGQISDSHMYANMDHVMDHDSGDLLVRSSMDVQETVQLLGYTWLSVVSIFIRVMVALAVLGSMDARLALILFLLCPLVLLSKSNFRKLRDINRSLKDKEGDLGTVLQENYGKRLFIRLLNREEERGEKLARSQEAIYVQKIELLDHSIRSKGILGLLLQIGYLIAFIWGTWKLQSKQISFGTMSAFMQLVGRVQGPFVSMMGTVPVMVRSWAALERIMDVLKIEREEP